MSVYHEVICILENKDEFEKKLDQVSKENNVFATQTHVVVQKDELYWIAICFCKP